MDRKVSLKDIAQKVGVSTALVSYVLNNKRENRVSKDLAQRIREAAAEMNYRTNQVARSLKTNKTYTIGLIVSDIANPFSSGLARIIEDEAEQLQYTVIFSSSDENARKSGKLIDTLLDRQVDGLIIAPPAFSEHQVIYLQEQQVPFVLVDRYFPDLSTNYVALDNYGAAFKGVEYLINTGRRKIGMITYDSALFHLQERKRGYTAALEAHGLPANKSFLKEIDIKLEQATVENVIQSLLSGNDRVDALLFGANKIAVAGLRYISSLPVKVPEELAIVNFDETEALEFYQAPFSYIKQPLPEIGRLAIRILLDSIERNSAPTQINLEGELVHKIP
ncbi:LacI family transcriptional regulator [Pseudoflavitalea sp. X16]|uniref:LacI family DNA-binding transcriptional regulator n=1 Tax=Paraflavitalea devenefica TaxID=2716334 RepID=UPI00142089A9|nr:substrate-binding domain-containing protein [Paraflavitalea devenefica]NII26590.1 LacI family transcriptional regulator [Paraflavitalea devenefica]